MKISLQKLRILIKEQLQLSAVDEYLEPWEIKLLHVGDRYAKVARKIDDLLTRELVEKNPLFLVASLVRHALVHLSEKGSPQEIAQKIKKDLQYAAIDDSRKNRGNVRGGGPVETLPDRIEKLIDDSLATENKPEEPAEAPKNAPFGKYALPAQTGRKYLLKYDPNTPSEEELINALVNHYSYSPIKPAEIAKIKLCLQNGWYQSTFRTPDVESVYRGIVLNAAQFKSLIGHDNFEPTGEMQLNKIVKSGKLDDHSSSWAIEPETAEHFANPDRRRDSSAEPAIIVIMQALMSDNPNKFLDGTVFQSLTEMHIDDEIIAIDSNIKVRSIRWYTVK